MLLMHYHVCTVKINMNYICAKEIRVDITGMYFGLLLKTWICLCCDEYWTAALMLEERFVGAQVGFKTELPS